MRSHNHVIAAILGKTHGRQPRLCRADDRTSEVSPSAGGLHNGMGAILAHAGLAIPNAV